MRIRNPLRQFSRHKQKHLDRWEPKRLDRGTKKALQILDAVHATAGLNGSIVECGVGAGSTLAFFSMFLDGHNDSRQLWAFDSFKGFPEGSAQDAEWFSPTNMTVYRNFDVQWVRDYIVGVTGRPKLATRPHFVPGFFPDSFSNYDGGPVSLLHLDVDLYQSYVNCFSFFAPKLLPGAIILVDEYDRGNDETEWPAARRAIDEFAERSGLTVEKLYTGLAQLRVTAPITEE